MGISTLVIAPSGSGKSTSIRNLDPKKTMLIKAINKPLPFPNKEWKKWDKEKQEGSYIVTDNYQVIEAVITTAKEKGKNIIVIDDVQYLMANEFMRRSSEKSFDKFTEIAYDMWHLINVASENTDDDVRVYFLSHDEETQNGTTKAKTIGKLLDDKITIEGLFTVVLGAGRTKDGYKFFTQTNGRNTLKSPLGMFKEEVIDNCLELVDKSICEYNGIKK